MTLEAYLLFSGILVYLYSLPLAAVFENSMTLTVLSFLRIYIYIIIFLSDLSQNVYSTAYGIICAHI